MKISDIHSLFLESKGISIDSRKIQPGQIYIAIKGERTDGNLYAQQALDKGAFKAIIDDSKYAGGPDFILVKDGLKALQELAIYHRKTIHHPVIGITGSNGKTTTKELIAAVLEKKYRISVTQGNFNNHIGVPLTLLSINSTAQISIVEMGANHIGEIRDLCNIADPNFGLITNIGKAHLKGFGSYEGVITAKTELYKHIDQKEGVIFYNPKDPVLVDHLPTKTDNRPYNWELEFDIDGLTIAYSTSKRKFKTNFYGAYNQFNIVAAYTLGKYFEVPEAQIHEAITEYIPEMNRSQIKELDETCLIMDAYNANPSSMALSLESFESIKSDKPKVLILGDMKELGKDELLLHQEIVDKIEASTWDQVILVGSLFEQTKTTTDILKFADIDALIAKGAHIKKLLADKIVLLKASRSTQLERIEILYN